MTDNTLSILKPSVNNLTARIFVRAAGLEFEELDVWGKKTTPEFLAKDPAAPHAAARGRRGCRRARSGRAARSCSTSATSTASTSFYPTDPGERAMVDSAMFYLIGTFYPLVTRATYPALGFPQYPGEVGDVRRRRRHEGEGAAGRRGRARRAARASTAPSSSDGQAVHRRRPRRRSPTSGWPRTLEFLHAIDYDFPAWADGVHGARWRRRSATRTRSRRPTCAATSRT